MGTTLMSLWEISTRPARGHLTREERDMRAVKLDEERTKAAKLKEARETLRGARDQERQARAEHGSQSTTLSEIDQAFALEGDVSLDGLDSASILTKPRPKPKPRPKAPEVLTPIAVVLQQRLKDLNESFNRNSGEAFLSEHSTLLAIINNMGMGMTFEGAVHNVQAPKGVAERAADIELEAVMPLEATEEPLNPLEMIYTTSGMTWHLKWLAVEQRMHIKCEDREFRWPLHKAFIPPDVQVEIKRIRGLAGVEG